MQPVILKTTRLLLDQPRTSDLADIVAFCRDPLFEHYMTLPWPYAPQDAEFFVNETVPRGWENDDEATWALRPADDPSALLGVVAVRRENRDVGYWLGGPHRGHGYMAEAVAPTDALRPPTA